MLFYGYFFRHKPGVKVDPAAEPSNSLRSVPRWDLAPGVSINGGTPQLDGLNMFKTEYPVNIF